MDNDNGMKTTLPFIIGRKRIMPTALFIIHSSLFVSPVRAQTWNEGYINQPQNLRYESMSPTRLSYNTTKDFAVASVGYGMAKGDFHAIDASGDAHALNAYIGGLRSIGGFSLGGHLSYKNSKDNQQAWNSTQWNLRDNPFVLCDSIPGDATTEVFDLGADGVYTFSEKLKAGLAIGLRTSSRSDQTDPRPHTTSAIIPITIGADYQLSDHWIVGMVGGVTMGSSVIEYSNVETNISRRYFLMKGMGDYAKRSSSDESGYQRDYKTTTWRGALNAQWTDGSKWSDFVEACASITSQDATDGSSYTFKGGDYKQMTFTLHNRLLWQQTARLVHNFIIDAAYQDGKASWYEQKRQTDLEHGNIQYYRVLSKNTNHKNQRLTASLNYQLDMRRADGRRDITAKAGVGYESTTRKQLLGYATPKQEIQMLNLEAGVGKTIYIDKVVLLCQLNGGYRTPQTQKYASGCTYATAEDGNIDADYVRPVFEWESAQSWHIGALADVCLPMSQQLVAGLCAKVNYRAYNGKNEYWTGYDGTHYTAADFTAYLKF